MLQSRDDKAYNKISEQEMFNIPRGPQPRAKEDCGSRTVKGRTELPQVASAA